jgi:hypothetical protein
MSGVLSDLAVKSGKGFTYKIKLDFEKGYQQRKYLEIPQ